MNRFADSQTRRKLVFGMLATAMIAAGCAGLPPAQTATDIKAISGTWKGSTETVRGGFGLVSFAGTLTITEDSRYEILVPSITPSRYVGTVTIVDGTYRFKSETTGGTGTFTLHEGDGRRAIAQAIDNGGSGLYWEAK